MTNWTAKEKQRETEPGFQRSAHGLQEGDVGTCRHGAGDGNSKRRVKYDRQVELDLGVAQQVQRGTLYLQKEVVHQRMTLQASGRWEICRVDGCFWFSMLLDDWKEKRNRQQWHLWMQPIYLISGPHTPRKGLIIVHLYVSQSPGRTQHMQIRQLESLIKKPSIEDNIFAILYILESLVIG